MEIDEDHLPQGETISLFWNKSSTSPVTLIYLFSLQWSLPASQTWLWSEWTLHVWKPLGSCFSIQKNISHRWEKWYVTFALLPPPIPFKNIFQYFYSLFTDTFLILSVPIPRPGCQQVYNLFHPTDPVAARIEPLLSARFSMLPPINIPRYQKYPLGNGQPYHLCKLRAAKKLSQGCRTCLS